jgi:hypothetical protein
MADERERDTADKDSLDEREPWGSGEEADRPSDAKATSTTSGGRGLGADASTGSSNPDPEESE